MKVYENDRDIKVSNLYLKLPQNMINKISNRLFMGNSGCKTPTTPVFMLIMRF